MDNPMSLSGKHILVTGASAGIGRATCIVASRLGAKVTLVARNSQRLNETLCSMEGSGHKCYKVDLNNIEVIEEHVNQIIADQGKVDGMVHCAAIGTVYPIKMTKPHLAQQMLNIHFMAFLELVRLLGKKKASNENASFVGISSVAAYRGQRGQGAYAAAKGAINSILGPMAKEYSDRRIRVNAVAFGSVNTEMMAGFWESGGSEEQMLLKHDQYMGIISPEDAANSICFLLSDASRFITGTVLHVDGGFLS